MSALRARYQALIAAGELRADAEQAAAIESLAALQTELEREPAQPGLLGRLFGRKEPAAPRGIYMWGGVGRGK